MGVAPKKQEQVGDMKINLEAICLGKETLGGQQFLGQSCWQVHEKVGLWLD